MLLEQICNILVRYKEELNERGVKKISIFGSIAHHQETSESDVDILVDFDPERGIFAFIDLKIFLEKIIGRKIDLVSKKGLHPALKDSILKEAKNAF